MKWEFISKTQVKNNSNNTGRGLILSIGIFCFLLAIGIELYLGSKSVWLFVIPLLYLCNLKKQNLCKKMIVDVPVAIQIFDYEIEIVFYNTFRSKKRFFSEKYTFKFSQIAKCTYLKKYKKLNFFAVCKYEIFESPSKSEKEKFKKTKIQFTLPQNIEKEILTEISKRIPIEYLL